MVSKSISPGGYENDSYLIRYLHDIRQFPILEAEEEYMLAKCWRDHGDIEAAHRMVTSHLRLVAKVAMGYRGYGLPLGELIAEGSIGMMRAVKGFDPDRGFRLATYAVWWIRASIQDYVLRSWSLVKIGTTAAQRKLFFNLRRLKAQLRHIDEGYLDPEDIEIIANQLGVREDDVITMNQRLARPDRSLNVPVDRDNGSEWQEGIADDQDNQESQILERECDDQRQQWLKKALARLDKRERAIIFARRLDENPKTLEELGQIYNVSRERIRQIESKAFKKLQISLRESANEAITSS